MNNLPRVAVIGAGAAGLAAARLLQDAGLAVTVFDKARRPGGRLAVRRSDWGNLHHGAPLVSLPDHPLPKAVQSLLDLAGETLLPVAAPNLGGGSSSGFSHAPSLNALAARWADGVDVRCQHTLTQLTSDSSGWWLQVAESVERLGPFDHVVLTAPTVQALALLSTLPEQSTLSAMLSTTRHAPCWSVMWVPAAPPSCRGLIEVPDPVTGLGLIVREDARDADTGGIRYVLHATPDWSEAHLEDEADAVAQALVRQAAAWLDCPTDSLHLAAHRWRYATVSASAGLPCLRGNDGLWYAGDACLGNTVIDALTSGAAAAEALLDGLSLPTQRAA